MVCYACMVAHPKHKLKALFYCAGTHTVVMVPDMAVLHKNQRTQNTGDNKWDKQFWLSLKNTNIFTFNIKKVKNFQGCVELKFDRNIYIYIYMLDLLLHCKNINKPTPVTIDIISYFGAFHAPWRVQFRLQLGQTDNFWL